MTEQKFEGFFIPQETIPLTDQQIDSISFLPKVVERTAPDGKKRFEALIGSDTAGIGEQKSKAITSPSALRRFIKEAASANNTTEWKVAQAIRSTGIDDPEKLAEIDQKYNERIGYVSDIHGGSDVLFDRLEEMVQNPPDFAVFEGDIVGTEAFTDLQRLFYNWVNNHSKNEILKDKPDVSDEELLSYTGTKPPEEDFSLRKGFEKLRRYELQLAGKSTEEIEDHFSNLADHDIADEIRRYAKYVHYGHYASNLPIEAKQALAAGLEANAQKTLSYIQRMQEKGTNVVMLEGNWDARVPIDFIPEVPTAEPLDPEKRIFRPQQFFEENGVPFFDKLNFVETETTLQILLPFDAITGFAQTPQDRLDYVSSAVKKARQDKKSVVMVSHGEPNWRVHRLTVENPQPAGEHAQVVEGLKEAVKMYKPDELIYGHMHDYLADEGGTTLDVNTKYALKISPEGNVDLVEHPDEFSPDQTVASYMQLWKTAETKISRKDKNRKVEGFGGSRQPMKVKQP